MENNSQPPAPAAPAKVTLPAIEPPKTTQASSNQEVVPMAARTAATDGSAAQPQRGGGGGTVVGSVPLRSSVQQHPQPSSLLQVQRPFLQGSPISNKAVVATAGTGTGTGFMPLSPRAVGSLARRPVQQTNPVVFGEGSSSNNQLAMQGSSTTLAAVAATALVAPMHGPSAKRGVPVPWLPPTPRVVRPRKLPVIRPPAPPPPPKLPVYRPPPPPTRPELASSSAAGNALLPSSSDTGFCVSNMQADPSSSAQVRTAEEGSDSKRGGGSRDNVEMLDLNFPPVSDDNEN